METTYAVVGGGIVGLAVAARLSQLGSTVLLERHPRFIHETSSRNSGVIHAGMYYPTNSLKTKFCMEGNANIWRLVDRTNGAIAAKRLGKWIGATNHEELPSLEKIVQNMTTLGIPYRLLTKDEMKTEEPNVSFQEAVLSPNTGIIDVSTLRDYFLSMIENHEGVALCNQEVVKLAIPSSAGSSSDQRSELVAANGDTLRCQHVVCCLGLSSERFWRERIVWQGSQQHVVFPNSAQLHFCKGRYVGYRDGSIVQRLIYPCPLPSLKGLGVHSVHDMGGNLRFGPDAAYVESPTDLSAPHDEEFVNAMYEAVRRYIPSIQREKMFVDFAGMRPKLSGEGMPFRDFDIQTIGGGAATILSGIESPGLTSCTAVADHIAMAISPSESRKTPALWS